jgi:Protein of unknown function (DUF3667)
MSDTVSFPKGDCANCHSTTTGAYCTVCGQKSGAQRLSTWTLIRSGIQAVLEMDSKVWITLRDLAANPGKVAQGFTAGTRVKYINPIKMFFVSVAAAIGLSLFLGEFDIILQGVAENQVNNDDFAALQPETMPRIIAALQYIMANYVELVTFLMVPLFAFFLFLQHRKRGNNFAETLVFTLYLMSLSNMISIVISLVMFAGSFFLLWAKPTVLLLYFIWASRTFFGLSNVRTVFSTIFSVFLYMVATYAIMIPFVYLRIKGYIG